MLVRIIVVIAVSVFLCILIAIIGWIVKVRKFLAAIKRSPDDAYNFFSAHPEEWLIFNVTSSVISPDMLPDARNMPAKQLLGPFEFRVPQLNNRIVTIYGKHKDSYESLEQFLFRQDFKVWERRGKADGKAHFIKKKMELLKNA